MRGAAQRRLLLWLGIAALLITVAGLLFGPPGHIAAAAIALLVIAWRHDNDLGLFLPLAVLFLIVVAVLMTLIYLLIVTHPGR